MSETFSYERKKRVDDKGRRWHFVYHDFGDDSLPYDERPYELLFRDEERKEFGRIQINMSWVAQERD